jgi:hypothetical protein
MMPSWMEDFLRRLETIMSRSVTQRTTFEGIRPYAGLHAGQISDDPLTFAVTPRVTVGNASGVLLAAASGTGRNVWIVVPPTADTGIIIDYGVAAAAATGFLLPPGAWIIPTTQEIRAIRAGAADVTTYVKAGTVP